MIQNFDNVTVTNLNVTDDQAPSVYQNTLQISPSGVQTGQFASFPPGQTQFLSYTATTQSSGIYVLSPATADFVWQAPNGTKIRYTVTTDEPLVSSSSGPWTQFTRTFTDLQPYSYLLLLPTPAEARSKPPPQPAQAGPDKPADTPRPANP